MAENFAQFLKAREQASAAYIEGNIAPLAAITSRHDPATFMPPSGAVVTGADAVSDATAPGASSFRKGSRGRFEIIQSGSAGDLGFWTGLHHAEMAIAGHDKKVAMVLRTTEVFRREDGAWKLVHRHADLLKPNAEKPDAEKEPGARRRVRAEAKITVQSSDATPLDQATSPALMEIRLRETFAGDIAGESTVRALQVRRDDRSASMVSLQRVDGSVGGRRGSFVLQGAETIENGKIAATWFVVPGSGTGDLAGLRGEGGFAGAFGKGSDGTLEYWFE
jgi:ketosteroid isomerase-like protein